MAWDRYAYTFNSPLNYVDPSGHCSFDADGNYDEDYNCTEDDFYKMTISQRRLWMKLFSAYSGSGDWFNNIDGILGVFEAAGVQTDSWLGWTDVGILQAISDGYRIYQGALAESSTGEAANSWKTFFQELNNPFAEEANLINLWGDAEAAGTAYGIALANSKGYRSNLNEEAFLAIGNMYRNHSLDEFASGIGGFIGFAYGAIAGSVACFGPCTLIGGFAGAAAGGISGDALATQLSDPRIQIFGISPVAGPAIWFLIGAPWLISGQRP